MFSFIQFPSAFSKFRRSARITLSLLAVWAATGLPGAPARAGVEVSACLRQAFGQVVPSQAGRWRLPLGAEVKLALPGQDSLIVAQFMGRYTGLDGASAQYGFFSAEKNETFVLPIAATHLETADGTVLDPASAIPIVRSEVQEGGTCGAHGIFNCLRQLHQWSFTGNGVNAELEGEAGRLRVFSAAFAKYYLETSTYGQMLETMATRHGFSVYPVKREAGGRFRESVTQFVSLGWPVMVTYEVSPGVTTGYPAESDYTAGQRNPHDAWFPKTAREDSVGRHAVVILGSLTTSAGDTWFIVSDSNHAYPVLWKSAELDKVFTGGIDAYVIHHAGHSTATAP